MSMIGEHVRLTARQLDDVITAPESLLDLIDVIRNAEPDGDPPPPGARTLSTHKAWHAIEFLLKRATFPVNIVRGERRFRVVRNEEGDCCYEHIRYVTPERVVVAANALSATTFDALIAGIDGEDLVRADVYPHIWRRPDSMAWLRECYEPVVPYFVAASEDGDAILCWAD